jgi:hypothetical protein
MNKKATVIYFKVWSHSFPMGLRKNTSEQPVSWTRFELGIFSDIMNAFSLKLSFNWGCLCPLTHRNYVFTEEFSRPTNCTLSYFTRTKVSPCHLMQEPVL